MLLFLLVLVALGVLGTQCGPPLGLMRVDADGDGLASSADVALVTSCQGIDPVQSPGCAPADVDRDGSITAADLVPVQQSVGSPVCNEFVELCDQRVDDVVFATAHNSYSSVDAGYQENLSANHYVTTLAQLESGYRGLMLDVMRWDDPDVPGGETLHLCHTICPGLFGSRDLVEALVELKGFLDSRPGEVVVLLFEHIDPPDEFIPRVGPDITPAELEAAFAAAGLLPASPELRPYVHTPGTAWPTLGELAAANTRLIVFNQDGSDPAIPFYHYMWGQLVWDTPFSNTVLADFDCTLGRGNTSNDLFILNHFLNGQFTGQADLAALANPEDVVLGHALDCWAERQQLPNFVAVDYVSVGDTLSAVDELNRISVRSQ